MSKAIHITIEKDKAFPSLWNRFRRMFADGLLTTHSEVKWIVKFNRPPSGTAEYAHIKLCGLMNVSLFNHKRLKHGSWKSDHIELAHEDSNRFIASYTPTGVYISTYIYERGKGPATTSHTHQHKTLGFIPYDDWALISVDMNKGSNQFSVDTGGLSPTTAKYPLLNHPKTWFKTTTGSHGDNGPSSPTVPHDVSFVIKRIQ